MKRPRYVKAGEKRSPMRRLLEDCNNTQSGTIEVAYDAQWQTLAKAERMGYVDDHQRLTDKGREYVSSELY